MKTFLQWLGGTADAGANSFLLCLPTQRALFGAAEGTQRVCTEHSIRIAGNATAATATSAAAARLSSVWLHSLEWKHLGGLPGLLVTAADAGSAGVKLFGPVGLKRALCAMRPFLQRPDFAVQVHEVDAEEWLHDGDISVKPILVSGDEDPLGKKRAKAKALDCERILKKMFPASASLRSIRYDSTANDDEPATNASPTGTDPAVIAGWWILGPSKPGKFDVEAARRLGIPAGPLYRRLQLGQPITLDDGRTIQPGECVAEPDARPLVLYLACRTGGILDVPPVACGEEKTHMAAVVHDYEGVAGEDVYPSTRNYAHYPGEQLHLALIGSYQQSSEMQGEGLRMPRISRPSTVVPEPMLPIRPLMKLHVAPRVEEELLDAGVQYGVSAPHEPVPEGTVTFLGTAACMPGKYRNVSGIHVALSGGILLDCGEGTYGQMSRMSLPPPAVICVSHLHADHHCGTSMFLRPGLVVVAPRRHLAWLSEMHDLTGVTCIDCERRDIAVGDTVIDPFHVVHCPDAFGFKVTHVPSGRVLVYSGDTRPCQAVTQAATNAHLLVHECTMRDELQHEAVDRRHTCFSEAISVILDARPKHAVLTHFSQRYAKGHDDDMVARLRKLRMPNVRLAVDFMQFPFLGDE